MTDPTFGELMAPPDPRSTIVVNLRRESYDVYIGRPSRWSNPFRVGQYYQGRTLDRNGVITAYKDWIRYSDGGVALQEHLGELRGLRLGCFCKPLPCHGDILVQLVIERFTS